MVPEMMTGSITTKEAMMEDSHHKMTSYEHETDKHKEHRMMSLSEITDKLHEEFEDEIDGANLYLDMANSAAHMNHYQLAEVLCAMAKDEFSHAKFIHCFLKESGVHVSDEIQKEWTELDNRFHKLFCQEEGY